MWQRVFVSTVFFLSLAFRVGASEALLECQQLAPNCYQLRWETAEDPNTLYHVFAADRWSSLMPIEMAHEFVESEGASSALLMTTSEHVVELELHHPYVRIIADSNGVLSDVAPLLDFSSAEVEEDEGVISKKRRVHKTNRVEMLEKVRPYLIPAGHPAKSRLDTIFSKKGVLASPKSMEEAGFNLLCYREGRGLVVARHRLLKGYLIKAYLDHDHHAEWARWVRRVKGSLLVQKCIQENKKYSRLVKVPKKWIYQLSPEVIGTSSSPVGPREFVLLVEDMNLKEIEETRELYLRKASYPALEALFTVIDKSGYSDCHIANVPFSRDLRIAFIDTEHTNTWPVHPEWLTKWFSPRKQHYWNHLIQSGGSSLTYKR